MWFLQICVQSLRKIYKNALQVFKDTVGYYIYISKGRLGCLVTQNALRPQSYVNEVQKVAKTKKKQKIKASLYILTN